MKAKEIMTKEVVTIKAEDNAAEALEKLFKMAISGLPVVDEQGKLLGMFTEKEVIAKILPSYVKSVGIFTYDENPKQVKQRVIGFYELKVKDVMRKEIITIDEDAPLCEIARIMLTQKARRTPVLDKNKNLIGIIARGNVVKAIFEEYK